MVAVTRTTFRRIWIGIWLAYVAIFVMAWPELAQVTEDMVPNSGRIVLGIIMLCGAMVMLLFQARLTDRYYPVTAPDMELQREQSVADAAVKAAEAVENGDYPLAVEIYEKVELYAEATRIAERMHDRETLVRLYLKQNKYEEARRNQVEMKDYEGAAWSSSLMGDISGARDYFRLAAQSLDATGGNPRQRAALWDRAGYSGKAALLYEEAGDLIHAAECFDLAGDQENAQSYARQARAFRAYEKSMGIDRESEQYKDDLIKSGNLLESMGDFIGAAEMYRDASLYLRAASLYEKYKEWERAARCFDMAGNRNDAERTRRQIQLERSQKLSEPPRPEAHVEQTSTHGTNPQTVIFVTPSSGIPHSGVIPATAIPGTSVPISTPSNPGTPTGNSFVFHTPVIQARPPMPLPPSAISPGPHFVPALESQAQMFPMFVAPSMAVPGITMPNYNNRVAELVRQSRFQEAAALAKEANDWVMAAALYERGGELLNAADIYRQIGRIEAAASALEKANQPRDAALLSLAAGNTDQAVKILVSAVIAEQDPELSMLLGEILVEEGAYAWAFELLHDVIVPEGVTEANAELFYRFARMFERKSALEEAFSIYNEMLRAGAECKDIFQRHERLAKLIAEPVTPASSRNILQEPEVMNMIQDAVKEMFIRPENAHLFSELKFDPPEKKFSFIPPEDVEDEGLKLVMGSNGFRQELSLFGGNVAKDAGYAEDEESGDTPQPPAQPELAQGPQDDTRTIPGKELVPSASSDADGEARVVEARKAGGDQLPLFSMAGRYAIKRKIAQGGMGIIYEARDTSLDRSVALKVIQRSEASPTEVNQFLLEARVVARLSHPAVITIYDVGLVDLKHYIAMELMRGGSVRDWVKSETVLSLKDALRLFTEVSRGLQAAHEAGIVHLDIKPTNLLLSDRRHVKIVDFGVARLTRGTDAMGNPLANKIGGTPGFMAPEQIRGEELLPRADIYALGITLFYMLVGEPPYRVAGFTNPREVLQFQLTGSLPSLRENRPDVPSAIEQLYRYCTSLDPNERYQSIDSFLPVAEQWYNSL